MTMKYSLFLVMVIVMIAIAESRVIARRPCGVPAIAKPLCFSNMAPIPAFMETIDYGCDCQSYECNDQLILPPLAVELPRGLGYFPSALPLVANCYDPAIDYLTTGAYLPIASECGCLTLAAPISPEWAPLVKPILL